MKELVIHGLNTEKMNDFVTLNHGSGGKQSQDLIKNVFVKRFGIIEPLTDSALVWDSGKYLAFTTDAYVVDPLYFPGGNIGKLAVCGTVNDLAVSGAIPMYLTASFIIEEGLPMKDLIQITESMADEALNAKVKIVTGDTKVVERGKCDKLFITTSGTGFMNTGLEHISTGERIIKGDKLIINGPLGNHAIAVLGARNRLSFSTPVVSDCASLNHIIKKVLDRTEEVHFMRDLTRGGLASVLNELASMIKPGITVDEASIPVDDPVKGLCEMLGFDPLYLANEGKFLIVVGKGEEDKVLEILRSDPLGEKSEIIGDIVQGKNNRVILNTIAGGRRILDNLSGIQLPRIC
ncbi:MAG: hydrogenase expression/formation protein HypE [Bacteroidales bacterium]|jgi:hydrogenase expression/formation protein HypE|nr:hydrogenase expression/formation protein HypE [Bacteroidales bacterium]